jgi:hypothetical protein
LQRIWGEWQKLAFKACDDTVRAYWVCRQEQGMLTPFKCRAANRAMNDCLGAYVRDEPKFEAFKAVKVAEIEAEQQAHAAAAAGAAAAAVPAAAAGRAGR